MADYRLYPATDGPASPASDSTSYTMGVEFYVTAPADLTGYWWWCADLANNASKDHVLWEVTTGTTGTEIPETLVATGALSEGAWNFTALDPPYPLTVGQRYRASITDLASGNNWYSATPAGFLADIVNGPLTAPSTVNATGGIQMGYVISSTPQFPELTTGGNYWMDVQVSDPGGAVTGTGAPASGHGTAYGVTGSPAVTGAPAGGHGTAYAVAAALAPTPGAATGHGTAYVPATAIVVTAGSPQGSGVAHGATVPAPPSGYSVRVAGREPPTGLSGREPFSPS